MVPLLELYYTYTMWVYSTVHTMVHMDTNKFLYTWILLVICSSPLINIITCSIWKVILDVVHDYIHHFNYCVTRHSAILS